MSEKYNELSSQLLRQMIEHATSGIVVTDSELADNPIIFANKAFYKMTGFSQEETIGFNCRFLQQEDKLQPAISELRKAIKARKSCVVTMRNYRKSGQMFWNELHIDPFIETETGRTFFIGVQHDVTASVELQQQRATYNAGLIHDIKGPLYSQTRIFKHLSHLSPEQMGELREELTGSLLSSSEQIEKTLSLYKLENELIQPQYSLFKAKDVIEEIFKAVRNAADSRGIRLEFLEPGLQEALVYADYEMAYRALINLVDNAIKVSRLDSVVTALVSNTKTSTIIAVMDCGKGLPTPIKEAFKSSDDRLVKAFSGRQKESSGLGLMTCSQIMRLHGGALSLLKSNIDGTDFALIFPKSADVG